MIKLIALLKRKPHISLEEFERRWAEQHTVISGQIPGLRGYRLNIATPRQQAHDVAPYDGTAELWFDSVEAMESGFATAIGIAAGADADSFCDVREHLYTREYVIMPGPAEG